MRRDLFGISGGYTTIAPTFAARTDFPTESGDPQGIAIGDLNEDGAPDIVAAKNAGMVSVFLNTTGVGAATATLAARSDIPAGINSIFVTVADVDGDGRSDLAVANFSLNSVSVFLAE